MQVCSSGHELSLLNKGESRFKWICWSRWINHSVLNKDQASKGLFFTEVLYLICLPVFLVDFHLRICSHSMMHNGLSWWIYSDETTFAWSFPSHWSNSSRLSISIIQNCCSELCFPVLGKVTSEEQRAVWAMEMSHLNLPSTSLFFPLLSFVLMVSPCVLLHTPFFPLLCSPHPFSLCLVCLPSQLLSKKRGLFRIHAGRKQRYPWQWACARGTLKSQWSITL